MTKDEQKQFVKDLTENVAKSITRKIEAGKIPENWDGIELRWLLKETFAYESYDGDSYKSRKREFRNTVLVNDL